MLHEAVRTQGNAMHGALNHWDGRLAVVACAFAFAALQGCNDIGVGIDSAL